MQPIWVTLHPTLNYSQRLPRQTLVTKRVWIEIPVRRPGSEEAGVRPGWGEAASALAGSGQPTETSRGVSCAFSRPSRQVQQGLKNGGS